MEIWIFICYPYSFPTEVVGEVDKIISSKIILCDHVYNSDDHCFTKHCYYKEKFDADHS